MKFTSQICTTKEQSEKLLALGLTRETADCFLEYVGRDNYGDNVWYTSTIVNNYRLPDYSRDFPAWSLHRLIEMYSEHYVCEHINLKLLTYDTIIENIRLDILTGTFNKEYLEQ